MQDSKAAPAYGTAFLRDRLNRAPISVKLTLIIMVSSTIALILAGAAFITNEVFSFRQVITHDIQTLADVVGFNVQAPLEFNDRAAAEEVLSALKAHQNIVTAAVYQKDGTLFSVYRRGRQPQPVEDMSARESGFFFRDNHLHLVKQLALGGEKLGTLYIQSDLRRLYSRLQWYGGIVAAVLSLSLLITYLVSTLLQRIVSRPIMSLTGTARSISDNKDYSLRASGQSGDELGVLVQTFNKMLDEIQYRDRQLARHRDQLELQVAERTRQLAHAEHLATLGTFAAAVIHEINDPNATIMDTADKITLALNAARPVLERHGDEDASGTVRRNLESMGPMLQNIIQSAIRIKRLTNNLRMYARKENEQEKPQQQSLVTILRDTLEFVEHRFKHEDITVSVAVPEDIAVNCDRSKISQVFVNLINNAVDALQGRQGKISIAAVAQGDSAVITFSDDGPGIPPEHAARIFDPFFTTKPPDRGTGLGMFFISTILTEYHGSIELTPGTGGACFIIRLPLARERMHGR